MLVSQASSNQYQGSSYEDQIMSSQPIAAVQNLFEAARAGDAQALEKLLEIVRPQILSTCYRMIGNLDDAEDAAQDALVAILKALQTALPQGAWQELVFRQAVAASMDFVNILQEEERQNGQSNPQERPVEPLLTGKMELGAVEILEQNTKRTIATRESMMLVFIHVLRLLPLETRAVFLLKDVLGCSDEAITMATGLSPEKIAKHLQTARPLIAAAREKIPNDGMLPEDARAERIVHKLGQHLIHKDAMKVSAVLADEAVLVIPKIGSFHGQEAVATQFSNMFTVGLAPDAVAMVEINGQPGLVCFQKRVVREKTKMLPSLVMALAISPRSATRNRILRLDVITDAKMVQKIGDHMRKLKVRAFKPRVMND